MYFGGIPTEIDIKKLREAWPETKMKIGDKFTYSAIENLLGIKKESNRFKTITTRWRKIIEKQVGIILGPYEGIGFKVLSEHEKLELSGTKLRIAVNSTRKSMTILALTDRNQLTDKEKADYDHRQIANSKIMAAAQIKRKPILPEI